MRLWESDSPYFPKDKIINRGIIYTSSLPWENTKDIDTPWILIDENGTTLYMYYAAKTTSGWTTGRIKIENISQALEEGTPENSHYSPALNPIKSTWTSIKWELSYLFSMIKEKIRGLLNYSISYSALYPKLERKQLIFSSGGRSLGNCWTASLKQ